MSAPGDTKQRSVNRSPHDAVGKQTYPVGTVPVADVRKPGRWESCRQEQTSLSGSMRKERLWVPETVLLHRESGMESYRWTLYSPTARVEVQTHVDYDVVPQIQKVS